MKKLFCKPIEIYLMRLISAWLVGQCVMVCMNQSFGLLSFAQNVNLPVLFSVAVCSFVAIFALDFAFPKANVDGIFFAVSTFLYAFILANAYVGVDSIYFYLALVAAAGLVMYYLLRRNRIPLADVNVPKSVSITVVIIVAVAFTFFVGIVTVCRYLSYTAPNFDFGIFCQMFHNMKETGLPNTTCERDFLLSHFGVHVSPIYYLILPFYAIFPSPVTLQVVQAVILGSSVIPLYLLCRKYNLSHKIIALISIMYMAYPALSGGAMYDIHENCFLPALLLWMFYFFEKEKWLLMYIFAFLTLLVKEDAFVYIIIFALYACVGRKAAKTCGWLIGLAGLYFVGASYYLSTYGMGVMANRFGNFIYDDSGLLGVFKTIILNPGYLFTQIFSSSGYTTAKLLYLIQIFVCICFIPFITKKLARYILILPVGINLIASYAYQYDIGFQYGFAITAFFFYLIIMNVADMKSEIKRYVVPMAAVATVLALSLFVFPRFGVVKTYYENKATYQQMDEILETIPDDVSVSASTFLLPHIAERSELYEVFYHKSRNDVDYVVLDMRPGYDVESLIYRNEYLAEGYTILAEHDGLITILVKP
ncbi:MAG: DUF2079 domain-containing protein [Clostridia bacterium]|nr:DUF2079 domain-containing protein [Clostridia bacterium]